jgi:hypothetical protein
MQMVVVGGASMAINYGLNSVVRSQCEPSWLSCRLLVGGVAGW